MLGAASKTASKNERDAWKRLQIDASSAGALTSGIAGVAAAAVGVTAAVTIPPLLVAGAVAWWAQRKLVTIERKIEDPPRVDVDSSAIVRPHPVLAVAFGSDPLEQVALQFLRDLSHATALEDAMVLTDERLQGAQLLRRADAADARAKELRGMAEALWVRSEALATIGKELSRQLREHQLGKLALPWGDVQPRGTFADALPQEIQARLFRAGMDALPLTMETTLPTGDYLQSGPLSPMATALDEATKQSLEFARQVRKELSGTTAPSPADTDSPTSPG